MPDLGGGGLPDLGGPGGLADLGSSPPGGPGGLPPLEEAIEQGKVNHTKWHQMNGDSSNTGSLEEEQGEHADDYVRPSQKGEKDARRDYPRGEDPLGDKENSEVPRATTDSLSPRWAKNSPLTLETLHKSNLIKNLSSYLDKSKKEKKELINESNESGNKSIMDEGNIIDE